MGTNGLIFAAIAVAWLAYLIPHFVLRRGEDGLADADPANRFSDSMRILRRGTAPLLDQDLAEIESFEVSTPLTRRAAIDDLRRLERVAAGRRRRVLIGLLIAQTAAGVAYVLGYLPWWGPIIPAALLVAFFVVARVSVRGLRRDLDARYAVICAGGVESTVLLSRRELAKGWPHRTTAAEPVDKPGALWDPVPITMPTYVSTPLAPRTVRTIDLSAPGGSASAGSLLPVTADRPLPVQRPAVEGEDDERTAATA